MVHILKGPIETLQDRVDVLERQNALLVRTVMQMRIALIAEKMDLLLEAGETEANAKELACHWMGVDPNTIQFMKEGGLQ